MQVIKDPSSIMTLANEVNKLIDSYWSRESDEKELEYYLNYWARQYGKKMFKGNDYNPTFKQRVGKKRLRLISLKIEGAQITL